MQSFAKKIITLTLSVLFICLAAAANDDNNVGSKKVPLKDRPSDVKGAAENQALMVGVSEVNITPPVGTPMAGGFQPRFSIGVQDPLFVKAIVLESEGKRLAYVILDLIALGREDGDRCVEKASRLSGIPADSIVWACTHTHTGPYTGPIFGLEESGIDKQWLASLPDAFARAVAEADTRKKPASMSVMRSFVVGIADNRRITFKNGRAINTWNLAAAGEDLGQSVGSEGPVDPELGILAFDDTKGRLLAVLFQYTLHTNLNFGKYLSADYPGVVYAKLRERFGPNTVTLFVPGACANINSWGYSYRQVGETISAAIIAKLDKRKPIAGAVKLASLKRDIDIEYRDLSADQEERIKAAFFAEKDRDVFRRELEVMRKQGFTKARTVLQAWRIGDVGFASLPGELFVEWGLKIKRESPFTWTFPVTLAGDYQGYLVTEEAWKAGGYESLIARSAKPAPAAVAEMSDAALAMLNEIYAPAK